MKQFTFLILCCLGGLVAAAQTSGTAYLKKNYAGSGVKSINTQTTGGNIEITGGNGNDIQVEVYVRGSSRILGNLSNDEIKKRLEKDYDLTMKVSNSELILIAKQKHTINWKSSLSISFKISCPQNISTDCKTSGGNIELCNLTGKQFFKTSGGNLNVQRLSGNIRGVTSGGNITVENSNDDIDLHTSGGDINAKSCNGKMVLVTSGGTVKLNNLQGLISARTSGGSIKSVTVKGDLKASTSGGNIDLQDHSGSLEAATSGGNIDATLTALGKYVTLTTSGGNVKVTIPSDKGYDLNLAGGKVKVDELTNFEGKKEKDYIRGSINGGGIPVYAKTSSGNVKVDFN